MASRSRVFYQFFAKNFKAGSSNNGFCFKNNLYCHSHFMLLWVFSFRMNDWIIACRPSAEEQKMTDEKTSALTAPQQNLLEISEKWAWGACIDGAFGNEQEKEMGFQPSIKKDEGINGDGCVRYVVVTLHCVFCVLGRRKQHDVIPPQKINVDYNFVCFWQGEAVRKSISWSKENSKI